MTPTPATETGANIRAEMARRGITQTMLAKHLGVAQAQVSKRLRGTIAFDINELCAIAQFLDVPLDVLLPTTPALRTVSA